MTFSNLKLPDPLSYGSSGGVQFATEVMQTHNGGEYRAAKWDYPVSKYNVMPAIDSFAKIKQLQAFFRIHKGRAIGFRFKDFLDYMQIDQIIACGDGKTRKFELFKSYWHDDKFIKRRIFKPVENTVEIYVNKKQVEAKIDYENGTFTLRNIPRPESIITASFEFDVPARFDVDYLEMTPDISRMGNYDIPIVEIKNFDQVAEVLNDRGH